MVDFRVSPVVDHNSTLDQKVDAIYTLNVELAKLERNFKFGLMDIAKRLRTESEVDDRGAMNGFRLELKRKVRKKYLPSNDVDQTVFENIQRRLLKLTTNASTCLIDLANRVQTVGDRSDDIKAIKAVNKAWKKPLAISFEVKQIGHDEINQLWRRLMVFKYVFEEAGIKLAGIVATPTTEDNKVAVKKVTEILSQYPQYLQTEE